MANFTITSTDALVCASSAHRGASIAAAIAGAPGSLGNAQERPSHSTSDVLSFWML